MGERIKRLPELARPVFFFGYYVLSSIMGIDKEQLRKSREAVAKARGWSLNPDKETVGMVLDGLISNFEKHGSIYCPCRVVTGNKGEDKKIICPCIYAADEVARDGACHCLLFVRKG